MADTSRPVEVRLSVEISSSSATNSLCSAIRHRVRTRMRACRIPQAHPIPADLLESTPTADRNLRTSTMSPMAMAARSLYSSDRMSGTPCGVVPQTANASSPMATARSSQQDIDRSPSKCHQRSNFSPKTDHCYQVLDGAYFTPPSPATHLPTVARASRSSSSRLNRSTCPHGGAMRANRSAASTTVCIRSHSSCAARQVGSPRTTLSASRASCALVSRVMGFLMALRASSTAPIACASAARVAAAAFSAWFRQSIR